MVRRIASVVGARPQFIKAAVLSRAMATRDDVDEIVIHTGQHFDPELSDVFFSELSMRAPHHRLGIHGGTHGQMTGRMLEAVEEVLLAEQPDLVVVFGDTNSTLAGALAGAKLNIPVAHVEAGVRSFNMTRPEEVNRVVTDRVSSLLFCPTSLAVENLRSEGVEAGVSLVGDVMYDAALHARDASERVSQVADELGVAGIEYDLATVHRAENTDDRDRLEAIVSYLREQALERPVVFPLHPRTREAVRRHRLGLDGLRVSRPLSYLEMVYLIRGAHQVLTDSGGLQKEAYFFRVPCVTLRDETEWLETVQAGWNRLWRVAGFEPRREIDEYGDGDAARRILGEIEGFLASST